MKLWHLLVIGGVAYLLLRKPTVAAPTVPVAPTPAVDTTGMTPEYAKQMQAAAAAAAQAAAGAVPGVPSTLPLYGVGWARV